MISGALLIDKPSGLTSYDVLRVLKRRFKFTKIGHAGTLDPLASGLLIVLLGEGTRLQSAVMDGEKEYEGLIRLGIGTSTDDVEGEVIERDEQRSFRDRDPEELVAAIRERFIGPLKQRPPAVSAVKVQGERSYKLARRGEAVELAEREVNIAELDLTLEPEERLRYRVRCSKGTYVRSLARDIGAFIGSCAAIETLRRTGSGSFRVAEALPLDQVERLGLDQLPVRPLPELARNLPSVVLPNSEIETLFRGIQAPLKRLQPVRAESPVIALFSDTGRYCGLLEAFDSAAGSREMRVRYLRRADL